MKQLVVSPMLLVFFACALSFSDYITAAETSSLSKKSSQAKPVTQINESNYVELLKPLDIYAPPAGAKKLVALPELYQLVQTRGLALKVSRETFNAARQTVKTEDDKKIPVVAFDAGHDQRWSKTLSDSDMFDDYSDRKQESGSRTLGSRAGFSLTGSPARGVNYKVSFPQLAYAQTMPSSSNPNPPRPDNAAFNASLDVSLLRDNPFSSESLSRKRNTLTLASAREAFKMDTISKLADAELAFYGLIQKHLQLSVQYRSLLLARALQNDVKEKIAAGESSALEATRAELQTSQAETDYMSSEIEYEAAVAEFRNSLAFDDVEGQGVFPDPKALNVNVENFKTPQDGLSIIAAGNPSISVARINRELAELDLSLARVSTMPSLSFTTSYGNAAPGDGWGKTAVEALKPNDRTFSIGLSYSQVLFNDSSKNSLQQSIVASQKASFAEDEAKRGVEKEYNALIKRLDIGSRRYKIAKISREIAEKKLNAEYERFKAGESSVRNVIDSQTEVNGARISEISARVDVLSSIGRMRSLLGRLPDGVSMTYGK